VNVADGQFGNLEKERDDRGLLLPAPCLLVSDGDQALSFCLSAFAGEKVIAFRAGI
jgi:hypothetical protein